MLAAELCFETTKDKDWNTPLKERSFVVPQLLGDKPAYLTGYVERFNLTLREELPYRFLPEVFIHRFIVQASRFTKVEDMDMWQSGIFLSTGQEHALVAADYGQSKIIIQYSPASELLCQAIKEQLTQIANEGNIRIGAGEKIGFEKYYQTAKKIQPSTKLPKPMKKEINIFVSYSSEDEPLLKAFIKCLKPHLKSRNFNFTLWTDHQIDIGDNWKEEILKALEKSDAAILFVSADFVDSDFIEEEELAHFLDHETTKLMIPVLARAYNFAHFEDISRKQFFKTKFRDYPELEYPDEQENQLMPFDYLIEPKKKAKIFVNAYAEKLAAHILKAVEKRYGGEGS